MTLPAKVAERMRAERAADARRASTVRPCPQCGATTRAGLDEDVAAARAVVDEPALPRDGAYLAAVVAHLSGRGVLARFRDDLHRLDETQLADGGPRLPLHLEHQCTGLASGGAS